MGKGHLWDRLDAALVEISDLLDSPDTTADQLLRKLDEAFNDATELGHGRISRQLVTLACDAAGRIYDDDRGAANAIVGRASAITPVGPVREALEASRRDLPHFKLMMDGHECLRAGDREKARALFERVQQNSAEPALRRLAATAQTAAEGKPMSGAPGLHTVNGFGTTIYGERDYLLNGSYVTTYFFTAAFLPIWPLAAYRVIKVESDQYLFLGKERIGPLARWWRRAIVLGALAALAIVLITRYVNDPERKATKAIAAARAVEQRGDRAAAIDRYQAVIDQFKDKVDGDALGPAGEAIVRLTAAGVPEPIRPEHVNQAIRVILRYQALPEKVRQAGASKAMNSRVAAWVDALGDGDVDRLDAAIRLVEALQTLSPTALDDRKLRANRALAERLQESEPLHALDLYLRLGRDGDEQAAAIVSSLLGSPSLLREAEVELRHWIKTAGATHATEAERLTAALDAAVAESASAERKGLLEAGDPDRLEAALARAPGDQEVAAELAGILRAQGNAAGARAILTGLGPPGRLIGTARLALASLHSDAEELADADRVLTGYLRRRLPRFQEAFLRFYESSRATHESIMAAVKAGRYDAILDEKIGSLPESRRDEAFNDWLMEMMQKDPKLASLRADYMRHSEAVPGAMLLGSVKLRRAATASSDERRRFLEEAERNYLSVQQVAEGTPDYHIGLGQVYFRLGRNEDGERELQGVLAEAGGELALSIADVYRELSMVEKARSIAKRLYEDSATPAETKEHAAYFLNMLADNNDEKETWLRRAGNAPFVKRALLGLEGERLLREGKDVEADAKFAEVAESYEKEANLSAAAANNGALTYASRYMATGKVGHLEHGVALLERAVKLGGESAIATGNLASAIGNLGEIRVLSRWVDVGVLRLSMMQVTELVQTMLYGQHADDIRRALVKEPAARRSAELFRRVEVLAPQNTDVYQRQVANADWLDDTEALRKMAVRLEGVTLDHTDAETGYREWTTGEKDALRLKQLDQQIAAADRALARANKARASAATLGAAYLIKGEAHYDRFSLTDDIADARAAAAAFREAERVWPGAGGRRRLGAAMYLLAIAEAKTGTPALAALHDKERRKRSREGLLQLMAKDQTIVDALRKRPELAEAVTLFAGALYGHPTVFDWSLARLAGDAGYEAAAAAVFDREIVGLQYRIRAKLLAGLYESEGDLALFETHRRSRP